MSPQEEEDLRVKHTPGAVELLDEKDRERVKNTHDRQLERAVDLLKGRPPLRPAQRPAKAAVAK